MSTVSTVSAIPMSTALPIISYFSHRCQKLMRIFLKMRKDLSLEDKNCWNIFTQNYQKNSLQNKDQAWKSLQPTASFKTNSLAKLSWRFASLCSKSIPRFFPMMTKILKRPSKNHMRVCKSQQEWDLIFFPLVQKPLFSWDMFNFASLPNYPHRQKYNYSEFSIWIKVFILQTHEYKPNKVLMFDNIFLLPPYCI